MESMDFFVNVTRKMLRFDGVRTDNNVFRLHYKVTGLLLASMSMIVLARDIFGDPIDCMFDVLPNDAMDQFCWVQSTFTVVNQVNGQLRNGKDVVQPGVGPYVAGEDEVKHQKYYYWVGMALFFQATLFCMGQYVWKTVEGNRVYMLVKDLHEKIQLGYTYDEDSKSTVIEYWEANVHSHASYARWFFGCELWNLFNVFGQIYFVNAFLGGEFTTYGYDVFRLSDVVPSKRVDPMAFIFPKVAKCSFYKYGSSGTIETHDGICVMPMNIVNEKIYMLLWAWLVVLAGISVVNLVYRVFTLAVPSIRLLVLKSKCNMCNQRDLETVFRDCNIGDWFMLQLLASNIQPVVFKDIITELAERLREKQNV